jgi:hypothetical protein
MIAPAFIFTVFMLTLGPVKTVPAFFVMTQDRTPSHVRALALKGTAVATAVSLLIALVMTGVAAPSRISPDDVRLAGGILLFLASRDVIEQFNRPAPPPLSTRPPKRGSVDPPARGCVHASGQSSQFAMVKALASGEQRLIHNAGLDAEIARLEHLAPHISIASCQSAIPSRPPAARSATQSGGSKRIVTISHTASLRETERSSGQR